MILILAMTLAVAVFGAPGAALVLLAMIIWMLT